VTDEERRTDAASLRRERAGRRAGRARLALTTRCSKPCTAGKSECHRLVLTSNNQRRMLVLAFANNNMNIHRTLRSLNVCSLFAFYNRWLDGERAVCSKFAIRPITADAVCSLLETYLGNRTGRTYGRCRSFGTDFKQNSGTGTEFCVEADGPVRVPDFYGLQRFIVHSPHAAGGCHRQTRCRPRSGGP